MGQVDTLAPLLKDMSCRQGLRIDFSKDQHHRDPEGCTIREMTWRKVGQMGLQFRVDVRVDDARWVRAASQPLPSCP